MNRLGTSVLVLASLFLQAQGVRAADPEVTNTPAYYPWSETSAFVRVPKTFLHEINILSVTISNDQTMEFVLTDDLIQTFALTDREVDQATASINHAIGEWRIEKAKHLVPTDEPVDLGRARRKILEKFTFLLEPSPEQKSAHLDKLEAQLVSILGNERSEWFWQFGAMLENNEVQGFGTEMPPEGMTSKSFYTFALQDGQDGPEISWYHNTVSSGTGFHGGGMSAGPYPPALDRYAPESMQSVLVRWRKMINEHKGTGDAAGTQKAEERQNKASSAKVAVQGTPHTTVPLTLRENTATAQERRWQDGVPFVDLPKRLITSLRVSGLTVDDEISPEARALFGLTESEAKAVAALYAEMRKRFEQMEISHLQRIKPTEYSFVLRAFPDQAKALQAEWLQELSQTVGTNRAVLLDGAIRTPIQPGFSRRGMRDRDNFLRIHEKGPSWLNRGMQETRIELTVDERVEGQPVIERMEWSIGGDDGGRGNIGVAPGAGGMKRMPERWRHLITPDILTIPPLL